MAQTKRNDKYTICSVGGIMEEWLKEDNLNKLTEWASLGLSYQEIADNMGIDRTTLWDWRKKSINISNSIKKGREVADETVENALYKKTQGYYYEEKTYELKNGKMVMTRKQKKYQHPDLGSIVFWLKNRMKDDWKERQEITQVNKIEDLKPLAELLK